MQKYICDQCGHEFEKQNGIRDPKGGKYIIPTKKIKGGWECAVIENEEDICYKCIVKMYTQYTKRVSRTNEIRRKRKKDNAPGKPHPSVRRISMLMPKKNRWKEVIKES